MLQAQSLSCSIDYMGVPYSEPPKTPQGESLASHRQSSSLVYSPPSTNPQPRCLCSPSNSQVLYLRKKNLILATLGGTTS